MLHYDFHIHSALSPCGDMDMTPNNIAGMAKICGLDAIAVSDHNTCANVRAVMAAGARLGVMVVPGMEVETAEEVHILTLYKTADAAEYAAKKVYERLPDIQNRPEIFGRQAIMDAEDNITGYEEKLLISPAAMSIEELFEIVREADGLFIPAHIDRHSYSVLTNLGFIPDNLDIRHIEISKNTADVGAYLENRPELGKYTIFRNSDAHYLEDISAQGACFDVESAEDIFALK